MISHGRYCVRNAQGRDLDVKISEKGLGFREDPLEWVALLNACAEGASDEPEEPEPEPEPAGGGELSEGVPPMAVSAEDDLLGMLQASSGPRSSQTRESAAFSLG